MATLKSEKTRSDLIEAALHLFHEKGFEATSFKDVAGEVGVTQPLLYTYFANKMNLLKECCLAAAQSGGQQIHAQVRANDSAERNLYQYLLGNLRWFASEPARAHAVLSLYYFAGSDPQMRKVYDSAEQNAVSKIIEILERGRKQKEWPGAACEEKAHAIHNLLVGEIYKQFYPTQKISPESRASALNKICMKIVRG